MPAPVYLQSVPNLFSTAFSQVQQARSTLGLAPLSPAGRPLFFLGLQGAIQEDDAPRIVIVPQTSTYDRGFILGAGNAGNGQISNKSIFTRWLSFDAHFWGDPDPTGVNASQDFDACLELEREFLQAMYENAGAIFQPISGTWIETAHDARRGRLYVLSFRIATPVLEDAYLVLPYATSTTAGVVGSTQIQTTMPSGNVYTLTSAISAPPP